MSRFRKTMIFDDVVALRDWTKSVLCRIGTADFWVPFSQIDDTSEVKREADWGRLVVNEWWAYESGAFDAWQDAEETKPEQSTDLPEAEKIYRRLAFKYHPDRSPESAEFMKDLNELWQAIKRELKKP